MVLSNIHPLLAFIKEQSSLVISLRHSTAFVSSLHMWSHPSISFIGLRPRRWKWSFFFEHSLRSVSSVFISEAKNWGFPSLGASAFDQFYQSSSNKLENFEFFLQQKSSLVAFASEASLVQQPSSAEQRFKHVGTLREGKNLQMKVRPPYTFTRSWLR